MLHKEVSSGGNRDTIVGQKVASSGKCDTFFSRILFANL